MTKLEFLGTFGGNVKRYSITDYCMAPKD
jgi:hypothetical protein